MCMNPLATLDAHKADAFAEHMLNILNHGATSLWVSLGHRTGLFDALEGQEPQTSRGACC